MRLTLLATVICLFAALAQAGDNLTITIDDRSYAAIAYSSSTGKIGYVYDKRSQSAAENGALKECGEADAIVGTWVKRGFCALAVGSNHAVWGAGWSYGHGCSTDKAKAMALENCKKYGEGGHIVAVMSSDGQYTWDERDHITITDRNGNVYDGYGKLISPGSGAPASPTSNSSSPPSGSRSSSSPSSAAPARKDQPNENGIFHAVQSVQGG